jgi:hypothetical protein
LPHRFAHKAAKNLIQTLCHNDPTHRLASIEGIQASSFMKDFGWERLGSPLRRKSMFSPSELLGFLFTGKQTA